MIFRLDLLGGVTLYGPAGRIEGRAGQPRSIGLLALLVLSPHAVTREKLIGYLWPESDHAHSRHLLNNSIYHLRQSLSQDAILGSGESVRLNEVVVASDVAEFEAAIANRDYASMVRTYRGPFLDGYYLSDAPEMERWVESERGRLEHTFTNAIESAAIEAETEGRRDAALEWWFKLVSRDPYSSRWRLRLARGLQAAGDPAAALRELQQHVKRLTADLGIEPDAQVTDLIAELRTRHRPEDQRS